MSEIDDCARLIAQFCLQQNFLREKQRVYLQFINRVLLLSPDPLKHSCTIVNLAHFSLLFGGGLAEGLAGQ